MSEVSRKIRESFKAADDIRDAGLTTPEDIVRYDDIQYGADADCQVLDVYRPKDKEGCKLPVIVSVHGGGWVYGDKERYQYYCMSLAQRGFAVVNFTYRLAPEHKFPCAVEDTNLVFDFILKNAEQYGFDCKHLFAVGDSAGAHNLGLYANILTNPEFSAKFPFSVPEGLVLTAIALNCGVYSIDMSEEDSLTRQLMGEYLPNGGTEEEIDLISVGRHITSAYPPVFILTAVDDFLKFQAPVLAHILSENNVPFAYRLCGDVNNRLAHVFHCDVRSMDAKKINDEECEFFQSFCR